MKYIYGILTGLIALFVIVPVVSAVDSKAYSMNDDWQACSAKGIKDSQKLKACITYPDTGQSFETCENSPKAIYFVRHGEKRYRDITGHNNEPEYTLSAVGQKMAQHLASIFEPIPVKIIYANDATRVRQTACPLMRSKKVERRIVCKSETKSERFLLGALCKAHKNEVVVVVGHAKTIREMLINLKAIHPIYDLKIELGKLYKVTFQDGIGTLEQPHIPYWKCENLACSENGAMRVELK